jgi:hypothetical protein
MSSSRPFDTKVPSGRHHACGRFNLHCEQFCAHPSNSESPSAPVKAPLATKSPKQTANSDMCERRRPSTVSLVLKSSSSRSCRQHTLVPRRRRQDRRCHPHRHAHALYATYGTITLKTSRPTALSLDPTGTHEPRRLRPCIKDNACGSSLRVDLMLCAATVPVPAALNNQASSICR